MAATFHLEIITPTRVFDEGEVDYLRAPGADGLFGVMAGHTDAIIALKTGKIKVVKGSVETIYATSGGYGEITANSVQLLVETAELKKDIDLKRAQEAYDRAKERLKQKREEIVDEERALRSIERALNRIRIAND